jgi:hypothetical protein
MKAKGKLDLAEVSKMLTFIRVETARLEHLNVSLKDKKKGKLRYYAPALSFRDPRDQVSFCGLEYLLNNLICRPSTPIRHLEERD